MPPEAPAPSPLQQGWQIYCNAKVQIQSVPQEDELLKGKSAPCSSPLQELNLGPLNKGLSLCSPELQMNFAEGDDLTVVVLGPLPSCECHWPRCCHLHGIVWYSVTS